MSAFHTLRGSLDGDERDGDPPRFAYHATLRVFSDATLDFGEIANGLGLEPTSTHRRGEQKSPRSPPYKQDAWIYRAPVAEDRALAEHIDALWTALKPHVSYVRALKARAQVDVFLGYSSNIDHAGIEIPHRCLEMFTTLELDFGLSIVVGPDD